MGQDNLEKLAAAPTKVPATTTQYNSVVDALQGHQVMRESDGTVVDGAYDIGRPASGRPRKLYLGDGGINIDGQDIDLSKLALKRTAIYSGKEKTSGYPDFLEAGVTTRKATLKAADTDFVFTINGEVYTLEVDLLTDDLPLGPAEGAASWATFGTFTTPLHLASTSYVRTLGEFGGWVPIAGWGANFAALEGTIQAFFSSNGELFLARIDIANDRLIPILRGIGNTTREVLVDNEGAALLNTSYLFLNKDLDTITASTTFPIYSATEPASGATDDYYYNTQAQGWNKYNGAEWEAVDDVYIGFALVDHVNCIAVECEDFEKLWDETLDFKGMEVLTDTEIIFNCPLVCSVAGELVEIKTESIIIDVTNVSDLENGEALLANNWCYCYIDKYGKIRASNVIPRNKGTKKGYYHSREYWRCIGVVFAINASVISPSYFNLKTKQQTMESISDTFPMSNLTTNFQEVFAFVPHISGQLTVLVDVNAEAGTQQLIARPTALSRPSRAFEKLLFNTNSSPANTKNTATISFLRNTVIECKLFAAYDSGNGEVMSFELDL